MIAVIGDGGGISDAVADQARELGRLAVDAGFRVITGGLDGVMAAASEGARDAERYREGDVVAILPSYAHDDANASADIVIATGLGHARNVVLVASADVVVAIGGRAGTLSEIALAWKLGRPVIALETTGGWAAKLAGERVDERPRGEIRAVAAPAAAVEAALEMLAE